MATSEYNLQLHVPEKWSKDKKGDFFENFVAEILRPMRLTVEKRLGFTGMEIDLLARGQDQPRRILVECKAGRDPVHPDVITKLMGNVFLLDADAGWLFTTSDLTKGGRALWSEIQDDADKLRKFTWYSPERLIDILIDQKSVMDPLTLSHYLDNSVVGAWTLFVTPKRRAWLVQLVEEGIPVKFTVFDGQTGIPLDKGAAEEIAQMEQRFSSLEFLQVTSDDEPRISEQIGPQPLRATVAKVIPGDTWADLRPARPPDFVGRDDLIREVVDFVGEIRSGNTQTRTFAIQGPSGWGKSSLVLKLADLAKRGRIPNSWLTAIDSRSATNSAFVSEAVRLAFTEAAKNGVVPSLEYRVDNLYHPLEGEDFRRAADHLIGSGSLLVLVFDQFEELFAKEDLFETFNAVREISLDIDAKQLPILLGFAWKTDISVPQQHPAYHLWHELSDRRKTFKIRQFGKGDIVRIINHAQRAIGKDLTSALRARLIEQCQGLPWLLKKLLVHILTQVTSTESQHLLLERELDVVKLFQEDLALLSGDQIRCLQYVAKNAPVAVLDVEEDFTRELTNTLIQRHMLVRSGMNYVIYWDIFRDYLIDGRVPQIPWARTFQGSPQAAVKTLQKLDELGPTNSYALAAALGTKDGACFNVLSDLDALQLVDRLPNDQYRRAAHLTNLSSLSIANHCQGQLKRHAVIIELHNRLERGSRIASSEWDALFSEVYPRATYSEKTVHSYASNLRRWLVFSGLLEVAGKDFVRPIADGKQMGLLRTTQVGSRGVGRVFLGYTTPGKLVSLLMLLKASPEGMSKDALLAKGFRNAIYDATALCSLDLAEDGLISLIPDLAAHVDLQTYLRRLVLQQPGIQLVEQGLGKNLSPEEIRDTVREAIGSHWKPSSVKRNTNGLRTYFVWAKP